MSGRDALAAALITTAGAPAESGPAKPNRRALAKELARRFRSAKDDDEAAEALEAVIELARTPED